MAISLNSYNAELGLPTHDDKYNIDYPYIDFRYSGPQDVSSSRLSKPMYTKKDGSYISQGRDLSDKDRLWLNYYYLPFVARSDTYLELDSVVYDGNNTRLTEQQRLQIQAQLNNGNPTPPAGGRIINNF
jgi:hypothetical protein